VHFLQDHALCCHVCGFYVIRLLTALFFSLSVTGLETCPCSSVINAFGQWSVRASGAVFRAPSRHVRVHQRIISNNSYARDELGDNPWLEKEGSTMFSIVCDRC